MTYQIITYAIIIVLNSLKITPIKYLCVEQNNQATKIKWVIVINTNKSRKTARERKREHTKFVYLVQSNIELVLEESSSPLQYNDE